MKQIVLLLSLMMLALISDAQDDGLVKDWTQEVMSQMTIEEKVGQLFMIRAFSKDDPEHIAFVKSQIKNYHVGGICFFQGDPLRQTKLVTEYQKLSDRPLLIAIDGEWGLGMRFPDQAISFPRQITIGAIRDNQLVYRMGREIGRQCKLLGINVNFAPDVDINNNPNNPVINMRSFGEDRDNVTAKAYSYMRGMQDVDVMSCLKHFPGHGDTDVDSHKDLPIIPHNRARLDSIELYPFQQLVKQGATSVMVAHLNVPALDDRENRPTTLSGPTIVDVLRKELGFDGIVYTDAMEMKGVTKHFDPGVADLEAFLAGNDVILLPEDIAQGYKQVLDAVNNGTISMERLDQSVSRILRTKEILDLPGKSSWTNGTNIYEEINSDEAVHIKTEIYEQALTLANNDKDVLPVRDLKKHGFASIALGAKELNAFQKRLESYVDIDHYNIAKDALSSEYQNALEKLSGYDRVVISSHDMSWYARNNYGFTEAEITFINDLSKRTEVIYVLFGTPYALKWFEDVPTVLVAYEDNDLTHEVAAQGLFGVTTISGQLPVTASEKYSVGIGQNVPSLKRIGYSTPERVGMDSDTLSQIAALVDEMIKEKAAPGCQVLVAKDNRIVYQKSFGYHTYSKQRPVKNTDVYDLASVTKVMATTLSLMHLDDKNLFDVDDPIKKHIPEEQESNKADIKYADILAHRGRLISWIPFYKNTLTEVGAKRPSQDYYGKEQTESFPHFVTPGLYLRADYQDSIYHQIFQSDLRESSDYRYSDLAFYISNRTVENLTSHQVDTYAQKNFYDRLGLRTTTFNPLEKFDKKRIPPTEQDNYFRMTKIHGTVHDMGAAMLNGVSGHAGLFSNSQDLAILMQMLLNKGYYGGYNYLKPATVERYTRRHWASSRRGLGFDLKELNPDKTENMSEYASRNSFGHLGFTGTAAFADPDNDIIYIFLSNRTYPTMKNNKLGKNNYRPKIQSIIYKALIPEENRDLGLSSL